MRRALALACCVFVAVTALSAVPAPSSVAAAPASGDGEAALRADADGPLRIRRAAGAVTFVGAQAGTDIDNPGVSRRTSARDAARAHLRRYGAAVGADRSGTRLVERRASRGAGDGELVRYQQEIGGIPVLGGEIVVDLGTDRELDSLNANLSVATSVPDATVTERDARAVAAARARKAGGQGVVVDDGGRWVLDPAAVGLDAAMGVRGVWRFEVRVGNEVRRLVLVDDQSGDVLLDVDLIQHIDRTVCDQANVRSADQPCTTSPARTEASGPSGVADVEAAFTHAGAVSAFYQQVAAFDLTTAIGVPTADGRKLASTVRVCLASGGSCPYDNAFWNGQAMFYGEGYAAADDVVGHEMTHGVIERTSGLLYWDQSGAINESLADIIGEIIDHRNAGPGDSATDWRVGEDLPIGALRDMADPTVHGQPDRMTSPLWASDLRYLDSGGVHTNSGVGNRAFQLISQGGTFNGRTVAGIDAGDPSLLKSATLWVFTMAGLTAFSEYADLALVLDQTCTQLIGYRGFTAADCSAVRTATAATEMSSPPASDPDKDAPRTCPGGGYARQLFDSESGGDPTTKFAPAGGWGRTPATAVNAAYGVNAFSGDTAWVGADPASQVTRSLVAAEPVAVPQGQSTFLAFRHWHLFEFDIDPADGTPYWWDGGTVEMTSADGATTYLLSNQPWDHGPTRVLQDPNAGRRAFAGSSRGWVGSRVDVTAFAGMSVRPTFTVRTDATYGGPGWYVDDIVVYTCDPPLALAVAPTLPATPPHVGVALTATAPTWSLQDATTAYQWRRGGVPIDGETEATYTPVAGDAGSLLSVVVTGTSGEQSVEVVVDAAGPVEADPEPLVALSDPALPAAAPQVGLSLSVTPPGWNRSGVVTTYQWRRDGEPIPGATQTAYTPASEDVGALLSVVVTGTLGGEVVVLTPVEANGAVLPVPDPLEIVTAPVLPAGTPRVGRAITVSAPAWNLPDTTTTYQWRRDGKAISGRVSATYTPVAADLGTVLSVAVSGAHGTESRLVVVGATARTARGTITAPATVRAGGTPYVGRRLTALRGTWSPAGISFTYQWLRDGRVISGATRSTFVIRRIDKGHRISVRITGRKLAYTTVVRTSPRRLVTR